MTDKLYFYSKSRDVYPGTGTIEVCLDPSTYLELSSIPRWRQVLSNFSDDCDIEYKGRTYRTIEHAFQAAKIALFSLESGSELSGGSGADAQSKRKMRKLNKEQLSRWATHQDSLLRQVWRYKVRSSGGCCWLRAKHSCGMYSWKLSGQNAGVITSSSQNVPCVF